VILSLCTPTGQTARKPTSLRHARVRVDQRWALRTYLLVPSGREDLLRAGLLCPADLAQIEGDALQHIEPDLHLLVHEGELMCQMRTVPVRVGVERHFARRRRRG